MAEWHSSFLARASKQLASSLDYETTLRAVARLAVPELADWCSVDLLDEEGTIRRLAVAHTDPAREATGAELSRRCPPSPTAPLGVPQVLRSGRAALISSLPAEEESSEDLHVLRELGMDSAIIVPLAAGERLLGALTLAAATDREPYGPADLILAEELAGRCSLAIDNARLYRQARMALQVRDTFLATVSHDLKSPLTTIGMQSQLLRRVAANLDSVPAERISTGLSRIEHAVGSMTRMIDELLDVARLELGQPLKLERRRIDLVELVRQKVAEYEQLTAHHALQLAADTELVGEWDAARLERVVDNLLSNAIKYSPNGGVITVLAVRDDDDETGAWAVVSVRDPGVGIPASDLPHVFERFRRATNVGRIGGTGIGLAVAREIVEQHGGSVAVDSVEAHGSVFTVRLPLTAPPT